MHLLNSLFYLFIFKSFFFFFFFFFGGGGEGVLGAKASSKGIDKMSQHIQIINGMLAFKI